MGSVNYHQVCITPDAPGEWCRDDCDLDGWLACTRKGRPNVRIGPKPNLNRLVGKATTADRLAPGIEQRLTAITAMLPMPDTKAGIYSPRAGIQAVESEWKADIGEMKADLHAREARLIKWIAGLVVVGAAAAAGVAIAVSQVSGPGVGG